MVAAVFRGFRGRSLVAIGLSLLALSCGAHPRPRLAAPDRDPAPPADSPLPEDDASPTDTPAAPKRTEPRPFRARGAVVCLFEEIERVHGAGIDTQHAHVFAFRVASDEQTRYYPLLPTEQSKALLTDERLRAYELILSGVLYAEGDALGLSGWRGVRGDILLDVYYWCEVCSIRGIDPGLCACCQEDVILREKELGPLKNELDR